jgi:hypothetical protein
LRVRDSEHRRGVTGEGRRRTDVACELGDRRRRLIDSDELADSDPARPTAVLEQDLGRDDFTGGLEQLDQVLV